MRAVPLMAIAAVIALSTNAPALATPVYLACELADGGAGGGKMDVTADEASGMISVLLPNGRLKQMPAAYSPAAVKWTEPVFEGEYTLSRTDLTFSRILRAGGKEYVEKGSCKLQEAPKRAF